MRALCHRNRKHRSLGLCNPCYLRQNGGSGRWYRRNKRLAIARAGKWNTDNLERRREISRRSANKAYHSDPQKFIKRYHNQYKTNLNFRLAHNLRTRVRHALLGIGAKSAATLDLLGCSIVRLRKHLEMRFKLGMTWKNYGKWHVDHIRPCASFNLKLAEQQRICFHFTNLQPLWALENQKKHSHV